MLRERFDFVGTIKLHDADEEIAPVPGIVPATVTPEGYLEADALEARDGLLKYSDGKTEWIEYRPREELEKSGPTFALAPITDDHPAKMLDATTWAKHARGMPVSPPVYETHNGTTYQRTRLRIADADLVRKVQSGEQCEVSIGFVSDVIPTDGQYNGIVCDAVQTAMVGNHRAIVIKGRAGPICRVQMDSAAWCVYTEDQTMTTKPTNKPASRTDVTGPSAELAEFPAPDGTMVQLPTWVVAMLQELQTLKAGGDKPAGAAPVPVAPVAAVAPAVAPQTPVTGGDAKDEDKEEPAAMDAITIFKPIRRKLDRLAIAAGVAEDVLDSDDPEKIARAYIGKMIPTAKCDAMTAVQLVALVETASTLPKKDTAGEGPWGGKGPKTIGKRGTSDSEKDDKPDPVTEFLSRQGY